MYKFKYINVGKDINGLIFHFGKNLSFKTKIKLNFFFIKRKET